MAQGILLKTRPLVNIWINEVSIILKCREPPLPHPFFVAAEFAWLAHRIKASGAGGSVTALVRSCLAGLELAQLVWLPWDVEMSLPCVTPVPEAIQEAPDLLLSYCAGKTSHWWCSTLPVALVMQLFASPSCGMWRLCMAQLSEMSALLYGVAQY